ncbi:NAD(P)/FAD-dependent oxidoreductase [Ketobacter alkanivorans]|uniref:FAD-dependent oxidoreductase n=1 Tax=Ketobacter alkanivorans TaxID=1917421 RepID=A0A2K9LP22_9GAMM|nr:FAD-dependent oxidoreductase [Ketobacter alkanivorans]AUM13215.1 FAD-dependent oxidoreductase [Ketobacter alkanivorans]MCP5017598.1 FAD-dependent oxidoreductase [Ketobacter sp.]
MDPVIIVGTGLAGYNLAKEFRKLNKEQPLTLLTSDDGRNYSKPMLSTGFTKDKTADQLAMADADTMAAQLGAEVRTGVSVSTIDTSAQTLQLDNGETLPYSQLVLAWGAEVFRPPLEGDGLEQVYSVNDLMDYGRFRIALEGKKRVAIVGGGLIGCEFANDLTNGGFEVEVMEPLGRPLPTLLPEQASAAVQQGLEAIGVKFRFGPYVTAVNQADGGVVLSLSDGSAAEADIVVSAIGLRPRIKVAQAAGIDVNRGIKVDRFLRTNAANVYALGDCSEVEGNVMLYVLPLMAGARALAKTLAGTETAVAYGPMPVAIKTPACPVVVAPAPNGVEGTWEVEADGLNVKALFKDAAGTVRGFALTGESTAEKNALAKQLPPLLG